MAKTPSEIARDVFDAVAKAIRVTPASGTEPVAQGALTDRSGSITTGGTSQQLAAANTARRYLFVENISAEKMYVNFGAAASAAASSIELAVGAIFEMESGFVSDQAVNIISATTGSKFVAKEG